MNATSDRYRGSNRPASAAWLAPLWLAAFGLAPLGRAALWLALVVLTIASPASAERVLLGYYATFGGLPVEQIPWDRLTHLSHAFLRIDAQGELLTTDAMPNAALTADGRKAGVPVLLTVGGGQTVRGLEKLAAEEGSLRRLAQEIVEVVLTGRYAGVDVDWEFPRNDATREAHAELILALREGLDASAARTQREKPFLLTVAVSASDDFGQWIDTKRIAPSVDWLNVMAYDLSGPWSRYAAHHTPLFPTPEDPESAWRSASAAMSYWASRGMPKEKLVMGVPLYGRAMPANAPYDQLDEARLAEHRTPAFAEIRRLAGEGWPAEWDKESQAPWLAKPMPKPDANASPLTPVNEDADTTPLIISYDDRNSVDRKAKWAQEQGYQGLFFWAIHQDRMSDNRHWLLDAANKAWPAE